MAPIEIPMEDELVHTDEHPFCSDSTCGCHEDELLISEVAAQVEAGLLTADEATDMVAGKWYEHTQNREAFPSRFCSQREDML